jgi:hypothetical protein
MSLPKDALFLTVAVSARLAAFRSVDLVQANTLAYDFEDVPVDDGRASGRASGQRGAECDRVDEQGGKIYRVGFHRVHRVEDVGGVVSWRADPTFDRPGPGPAQATANAHSPSGGK